MLNLLQMFVSEGKMPIAGLIVILYVVIAEWRIAKMKKRWISCVSCLAKNAKRQNALVFRRSAAG